MQASELGPVTEGMYGEEEGPPPAIIREWQSFAKAPSEFVCFWAGVIRERKGCLGWTSLTTHQVSQGDGKTSPQEMSPTAVERLLSPLAHEGRVRIMQALLSDPLSPSELSKATGFQGGGLYHHLRELEHAEYVVSQAGQYRLTNLGRELLVTVLSMANELIKDRGERGLGVESHWQEPHQPQSG